MKGKFLYSRQENVSCSLFPLYLIDFIDWEVASSLKAWITWWRWGNWKCLKMSNILRDRDMSLCQCLKCTSATPAAVPVHCREMKTIAGYMKSMTFLQMCATIASILHLNKHKIWQLISEGNKHNPIILSENSKAFCIPVVQELPLTTAQWLLYEQDHALALRWYE